MTMFVNTASLPAEDRAKAPSVPVTAPVVFAARGYGTAKAILDFVLAGVLLILSVPLMLLAMILVRLTSRGPAIYTQTRIGKNGQPFAFHLGPPVDPSGTLPDGRKFQDIRSLKRLLLADERQIARNLTRELLVFATGAPVRFGDRAEVERILDRAAPSQYGVRSIIEEIVQSSLFQTK